MANSQKDQNGRNSITVASSSNGTTILQGKANSITHRLVTSTSTVGDNGNNGGNAMIDENSVPVWTALSSAGNGAIIEVYGDPLTNGILIQEI